MKIIRFGTGTQKRPGKPGKGRKPMHQRIIRFSLNHPKLIFVLVLLGVLGLGALIPRIQVDTDPENMLSAHQPARVFHDEMKKEFSLYEMIVVGVVNETDPDGVFNPDSLARIHALTKKIENIDGVVRQDLLSPSTVDNISQEGPGTVRFEWLMSEPPETREEARAIRDAAERIPTLKGTVLSEDGRAIAIYVPIVEKKQSYRIATEIEKAIDEVGGHAPGVTDQYHITGLPVAENTFGVEMFKQMAISAPLAGLVIFLMMWYFFRSTRLIIAPMLLAIATVVMTMGTLIGLGFTVHIMSSMIPIFLMPIAVVDSVHILSEFSDRYALTKDKRKTIEEVMKHLFWPMLYTSLTSVAGFISLAFTPIPPVQVFGIFVGAGILLAFLLTITFIPAYVMTLSDKSLARMSAGESDATGNWLARLLRKSGDFTLRRGKYIISAAALVLAVSIWGITKININDNPVRWFHEKHRIRIADKVLNEHFAGTYMAFLVLDQKSDEGARKSLDAAAGKVLEESRQAGADLSGEWQEMHATVKNANFEKKISILIDAVDEKTYDAPENQASYWEQLMSALEDAQVSYKYFQSPEALHYIEKLQRHLESSPLVGKTSGLPDIVKTVHRELREGKQEYFSIPETSGAVAQTILSFQSSHRPGDLWHMVSPDYRTANLWVQLKSGDNQDMASVVDEANRFIAENPPPAGVEAHWAGLTYLNVVWQEAMVTGMLESLMGSFVMVLIMMIILFRSFLWGIMAMVPLSLTIVFIYGFIGLVGKDYDMPVAVLSSLTLGLSVDFAIHFLQRARDVYEEKNRDFVAMIHEMFEEPGRAISRNALVIAIGFLPLLAAPLVPYNTVGFFMAAIMTISSIVTILLLPALLSPLRKWLGGKKQAAQQHEPHPKGLTA